MPNNKIITWGIAGYVLFLALLPGVGAVAVSSLHHLHSITENVYAHPFAVNNAALEMKGELFEIRNKLMQLVLVRDHEADRQLLDDMALLEGSVSSDFEVIKANFLGEMSTVSELEKLLQQWDAIRAEIIQLNQAGRVTQAEKVIKIVGTPKFAEIVPLLNSVVSFTQQQAKGVVDQAADEAASRIALTGGLMAGLIAVSGFSGFVVMRRLFFEFRRKKKIEAGYLESQEKFHLLFESANACLLILDMDGRIADINQTGCERLGYTKEEMVGMRITHFDTPEFAPKVAERIAEIKSKGYAVFESAHERKDGSVLPVEINARVVELNGRKQFFSIIRDITERKRSEQALRESEAQYRAVIETSGNGFWMLDLQGHILEVNDAYVRRSGYSREELLAMRISDLEANEIAAETAAHIEKIFRDGHDRFESYHRTKDGIVWPVEVTTSYWPIGEGRLFGFFFDLTERRQVEEAILASERRYRTLFANMRDGFAYCRMVYEHASPTDFTCIETNSAFERMLGLQEIAAGKTADEIMPGIRKSNPELIEIFGRVAMGGETERFETHIKSLDSWFAVSVYSLEPGYFVAMFDNITIRKRGEQMLSKRLAYLTKLANDIIFLTDEKGKFVDVNDRAIEAYGYSAEEFATLSIAAVRAPEFTPPFMERKREIERVGAMRFESVHVRKGGEYFPVEVSIRLIDIDGEKFVQSIVRDISDRRKAEKLLKDRERELAEAQRLAKIGSWTWDVTTGNVHWSEELYHIFGYDPALPVPAYDEYLSRFSPESRMLFEVAVEQAKHAEQVIEFDLEVNTLDGGHKWIGARYEPMRDDGGMVTGIRGIIQDVSERKRQEEQVQAASREIADLYNNAPCGYHSLDKDGVFVSINDTELSWLGYRRKEMVGKKRVSDLLTPDGMIIFNENFPKLKQNGFVRDIELELIRKDGGTIPVLISATTVTDSKGEFLKTRSMVYNMTERKQMEEERADYLRRLQKMAHHMVDMQEQERRWLSSELHDRNSANLAAITINLKNLADALPEKAPTKLRNLLADTQALLEDTMDSVREICMNLRPVVLDDAGLWPALEGYAQQFSRRTGIAVHLKRANGELKFASNIKSALFRITQEALTNCAKHAQATSIYIGLDKGEHESVLTISDDGRGFDPDEFGQPGHAPGLGLVTMRERAEFAGGKFSYATSPGEGMRIRVEIPDSLNVSQP